MHARKSHDKPHAHRAARTAARSARYHQAHSVAELAQRNIETIAQLENAARAERSPIDRIVDTITDFCGNLTFVWMHLIWFGGWIAVNTLPHVPRRLHFDPFPFQLLTLVVSLEAIFLSTFILISQNRQSRLSERRSHLDLQINLLSEQETTKILAMLDAIQKHLGVADGDPEVSVLEEATRPDELVQQIETVIEHMHPADRDGHGVSAAP